MLIPKPLSKAQRSYGSKAAPFPGHRSTVPKARLWSQQNAVTSQAIYNTLIRACNILKKCTGSATYVVEFDLA